MKSTKTVINNLKSKIESRKEEIAIKRNYYVNYVYNKVIQQVADSIIPPTKSVIDYKFKL